MSGSAQCSGRAAYEPIFPSGLGGRSWHQACGAIGSETRLGLPGGEMSLRTFVDSSGREWQAYDVVPREEERRHYDRRSGEFQSELRGEPHVDDTDERREGDRRLTVGGRERIPAKSWLTFEGEGER